MTNYTRATEAAASENWLAAIAYGLLGLNDEFRLPDTTFDNGPTPYAALRALDEIRTLAKHWNSIQGSDWSSIQQRNDAQTILDILTRHGLNEGNT